MAQQAIIHVYNQNLERIGVVMQYTSLIWAKRYVEKGDCELYLPVTLDALSLFRQGYYLVRQDDDMVCVIRKIEITTDVEQGNMLTITGIDVRTLIDQRVIAEQHKVTKANAEAVIRELITESMISAGNSRNMRKPNGGALIDVQANTALTNKITTQMDYGSVGDKIREIQKTFGWGGRFVLDTTSLKFVYRTYKGADKRNVVKFSPKYYTLGSSDYVNDQTKMKNVTYIAFKYNAAYGNVIYDYNPITQWYGTATGTGRYEQIIKKDSTEKMKRSRIEADYPGGIWYHADDNLWIYQINTWTFEIPPGDFEDFLRAMHPEITITTQGGVKYGTATDYDIAYSTSADVTRAADCILTDVPYILYMLGLAQEECTKHPAQVTFTGEIIPDLTFQYKEDYDLGDIVTIENEYGISSATRITEIVENWDDNGYQIEIKFDE